MAQGAGKLKAAKTSGGRKNAGLTKKGKRQCAPKRAMASKEHATKKVRLRGGQHAGPCPSRALGFVLDQSTSVDGLLMDLKGS